MMNEKPQKNDKTMNGNCLSLLAAAALLLWACPAGAQTTLPETEKNDSTALLRLSDKPLAADSLERLDDVDTDLVALHRTSEGDEVVLEVGGFGITLSGISSETIRDRAARVKTPRFNLIALSRTEWGFNLPLGTDYGAYPAGTDRFLDFKNGKSFHFSTMLVGLDIGLDKNRHTSFAFGLRYTVDNYRLSDRSMTLGNEDGMVVPVTLDEASDKSKLRVTSLGIPLTFSCTPAKHLGFSLTGYFDFTMGANSIYKKPKVKNPLSGVNAFRFGVGATLSYYTVGIYVRYSVTPLFEKGVGPEMYPLSIGLNLAL